MATTLFKIVFAGQLRDGVDLQTAKLNLARLFGSEVVAVEKLFNGETVTLKRGLTETDAQTYLDTLRDAGIEAQVEADPALSLNLDEVQTDIERPPAEPFSPYAPPRAPVVEQMTGHGELKALSFQGRIGRVRYLAWTLAAFTVLMLAIGVCVSVMSFSLVGGGLLIALTMAAFVVVSFQIGCQRLHDLGWSGWLLLLTLVPYVGSVFLLLLVVIPGNKTANRYGPLPPPNNRGVKIVACLWLLPIVLSFIGGMTGGLDQLREEVDATTTQYEQSLLDNDGPEVPGDDRQQEENDQ
jgi:uncharacterized membrane protein YhaH (DUF805 family)